MNKPSSPLLVDSLMLFLLLTVTWGSANYALRADQPLSGKQPSLIIASHELNGTVAQSSVMSNGAWGKDSGSEVVFTSNLASKDYSDPDSVHEEPYPSVDADEPGGAEVTFLLVGPVADAVESCDTDTLGGGDGDLIEYEDLTLEERRGIEDWLAVGSEYLAPDRSPEDLATPSSATQSLSLRRLWTEKYSPGQSVDQSGVRSSRSEMIECTFSGDFFREEAGDSLSLSFPTMQAVVECEECEGVHAEAHRSLTIRHDVNDDYITRDSSEDPKRRADGNYVYASRAYTSFSLGVVKHGSVQPLEIVYDIESVGARRQVFLFVAGIFASLLAQHMWRFIEGIREELIAMSASGRP